MSKRFLLLGILYFISMPAFSQQGSSQSNDLTTMQQQKILPPSPDAAALGKYGNIPVSTYTGVPDINVPVYNIKYKDINIPISLSYHASGITVEEESGWTGLGWVLSGATGVITRQIRGSNDLVTLNDGFHHNWQYSVNSYKGYPFDPVIPSQPIPQSYITDVCQKNVDPEPDIFYFNFLGKSGSFILEKGQILTDNFIVGTPISAEKIDIRYDKTLNKWIITTPDGYKFYFNVKEMQEVKRTPAPNMWNGQIIYDSPQNEESYIGYYYYNSEDFNVTAWYIDKIVSPLGEEVNFIYDVITPPNTGCINDGRQYSTYGSVKNTFTDQMDKIVSMVVTGTGGTTCWGDELRTGTYRDRAQTFTAHIYLKEIQFKYGTISFLKSNREDIRMANDINAYPFNGVLDCTIGYIAPSPKGVQKLDAIVVKDEKGAVVRNFNLGYSYFNSTYAGSTPYLYKRLKLISFTECGPGNLLCKQPTQFTYDETYSLPSKYSRAMDFWGYYNGATGNVTRIAKGTYPPPGVSTVIKMGDADRQPNPTYMKSGVLTKITYPTGGSTEFEFEPHDYYAYGSGVFTMTDFENNNTTTTQLVSMNSVGGSSADINQSLNLAQATQIDLVRTLGFYPALTNPSGACCTATAFGTPYSYNVASPFIQIKRNSDNAIMVSYSLGEYDLFLRNCASPCSSSVNSGHGGLMNNSSSLLLAADNYTVTIKQYWDFQSSVVISKTTINPRVIPLVNGVYAKTAGGLRIKTITDKNLHTNVNNVKSYDYTKDSLGYRISSGRLMMFPNCHVLEGITALGDPSGQCGGTMIKMYGKSYSTVPLGNSANGSIVGYDTITVRDGLTNQNGRAVFAYKNFQESQVPGAEFFDGFPNRINTDNGLLMNEKYINSTGGIIKETTNQYTRQLTKYIPALAFRQSFTGATMVIQNNTYDVSCYSHQANLKFDVITDRWVPTRTTEVAKDVINNNTITTVTDFVYNTATHLQLTSSERLNSKQETIKTVYTYPNEAAWIPTAMWQTNYIYSLPVEQKVLRNAVTRSGTKFWYKAVSGKYVPDKIESTIGATTFTETLFPFYDAQGNLTQKAPKSGIPESYVWDYHNTLPVAQVTGAVVSDIAYTSFESDGTGNWTGINSLNDVANTSLTGRRSYYGTFSFSKSGLSTTKTFTVSYWSKNGSYTVNGGTTTAVMTAKGWSYYQHSIVNPASGTITVTGTGAVDELRLYPAVAQMVSITYDPLVGTTSQCDANNNLAFYIYDDLGRLTLLMDDKLNILKKYCYNYQGQTENCNVYVQSIPRSLSFTKSCTAGNVGNNVTYTVPAGTYFSNISVNDANAKADADAFANGQDYANATGTCSPGITINGTNSKGSSFSVKFTKNVTGEMYTFYINPNTLSPTYLGLVLPGTYSVQFSLAGSPVNANFNVNGNVNPPPASYGYTFNNIVISATSSVAVY